MNGPKCSARSSSTKAPCGNRPARGSTVCWKHGGKAPQVKAKALERAVEEQARRALRKLTGERGTAEPVANPLLELSKIAGEALRWKEIIAGQVAQLEQLRYQGVSGEQVRAEILLFERALDRCAAVLATIVRLNIDERLATITEQQGHILASVITTVLEQLDLGDKAAQVRELVAVELERLDASA